MKSIITNFLAYFIISNVFSATITVTNTNDNGTGSLRQAVTDANDGDEIVFDANLGTTTILLNTQIEVGKNITIDGDNRIILDGQNTTRMLAFNFEREITLKNITLQNGKSTSGSSNAADDRGGAVRVHSRAKIFFENVIFLNNEASGYGGGAVGATGTDTQMTFTNCEFRNNICRDNSFNGAGAIALFAGGTETFLKTTKCTFENNEGINGGAIGSSARIEVDSCIFSNNSTLYATNNGYQGTNSSGRGDGGAIFTDRPEHSNIGHIVTNSDFINNSGSGTGGAVFLFLNSGQEGIVRSCYFEGNSVVHSSFADGEPNHPKGFGGALRFGMNGATTDASTFIVENSTFYQNNAWNEGGAVWITRTNTTTRVGTAVIRNCTFVENTAQDGPENERRGGAITTYFDTDIENCTFSANSAQDNSGAIYHHPLNSSFVRTINIRNCIFHNNTSGDASIIRDTYTGNNNIEFPLATAGGNIPNAINQDPLLQNLADNGGRTQTMALQEGSPAVDAGINCTPLDQRNATREGDCDIGAYELGGTINGEIPIVEVAAFNLITPNGDGQNDTWRIDNLSGDYKIKVFTKTGQIVFETDNYNQDWAGTNKSGETLPEEVYYFIISIEGIEIPKTGYVTIIK